jgi:hypothetical protein
VPTRRASLVALLLLAPAAPARAGEILTPFALPNLPDFVLYNDDVRQGFPVPPEKIVTDQYAAHGVVFDRVAIGPIGETIGGWMPTGSRMFPPDYSPNPSTDKLNFSPGFSGVVSGRFVVPGTNTPARVTWLNAEFVNVEAANAAMWLTDAKGNGIANPYGADPGFAPNPTVVLRSGPLGGITGFDLYVLLWSPPDWDNAPPWAIASLEFDTPTAIPTTAATPEPTALALAGAGLAVVAFRSRRRGTAAAT